MFDAGRTAKLCDFNTVRDATESPMTQQKGTRAYMAPEVLNGRNYSQKCDVYSLGQCV